MTTITIDGTKALSLLDEAVAHRGEDFVYPSINGTCWYKVSGHNSHASAFLPDLMLDTTDIGACGVGYILLDLLDIDPLYIEEETEAYFVLDRLSSGGTLASGYTFDDRAKAVLSAFQSSQDRGDTWGTAAGLAKAAFHGRDL